MISKLLTVGCLAGFAAASVAQPVELVLDDRALIDFDLPPYVAEAGIRAIDYFPFEQPPRVAIQTHLADLTCEFQDASGAVVAPPFSEGGFVLEIDRIPTPFGGSDPNVGFDGQPIDRDYPLDPASGSISQIFMAGATVLDICTSGAACDAAAGASSVHLFCREAGTRVFDGDFDPIVADLTTAWSTSLAGDSPPFEVVAGDAGGTLVKLTASNAGQLDVSGVSVDVSATLPAQGLSCPQVITAGTDLAFDASCSGTWTVGDLDGGASAEIELRLIGDSGAALGESMTLSATISGQGVADVDPANDTALADASIVKITELLFGPINSIPSTSFDLTNPPAVVDFSIPLDPSRGPSELNEVVDVTLLKPSSGSFTVSSNDADFNPLTGVWSRQLGTAVTELSGTFTVESFEPGTNSFCFGVGSVQSVPGASVFISGDSQAQKCLTVTGPESVDLATSAGGPTAVVAGSAPAGSDPANLAQTLTLTNDNATFDARELVSEIRVTVPPSAGTVTVTGDGIITQDGIDPGLWIWDVGTLPVGVSANATVFVDIPASAVDGEVVTSSVSNVTVAADQNLVDPLASADVSTTIEREFDLSSSVIQALPKSGAVTAAPPGGGAAENLAFFFEVEHVLIDASNATGVEAQITVAGPGGTTLPQGTVVLESISVPPGDSSNVTGLTGDWTIGSIVNSIAIAPQATVMLSVFEGIGDGAEVCLTGAISAIGASETDINSGNDSSGEICALVVDNSSP